MEPCVAKQEFEFFYKAENWILQYEKNTTPTRLGHVLHILPLKYNLRELHRADQCLRHILYEETSDTTPHVKEWVNQYPCKMYTFDNGLFFGKDRSVLDMNDASIAGAMIFINQKSNKQLNEQQCVVLRKLQDNTWHLRTTTNETTTNEVKEKSAFSSRKLTEQSARDHFSEGVVFLIETQPLYEVDED